MVAVVQLPAPLICSSSLARWVAVVLALLSPAVWAQAPAGPEPERWDGTITDPNIRQVTAFAIDEDKRIRLEFYKDVPFRANGMPAIENLSLIHISEPTRPY